MSRLTTFSKVLIVIAVLTASSLLVVMCYNCTQPTQYNSHSTHHQTSPVQDYGDHQIITQPGGSQVVVVKDNFGNDFFMDYLMFQSLMNMTGGMSNVYGYRDQHRYDPTWDRDQTLYRSKSKTVVNNYYGTSVDDSRSFTEQVKQKDIEYEKSKGFSNQSDVQPNTTSVGKKSEGFSEKWHSPNVTTSIPEPKYTPSSGFKSSGSTSTSTYNPSKGFGSSNNNSSYKPSSGFGTSKSNSTYKPSSGFKSNSSNKSSSSPSKGFGKKN